MAIIVGIIGSSGEGKTSSTIVNPDGYLAYNYETQEMNMEEYEGMNPDEHLIINLDMKETPLPGGMWCKERRNYIRTADLATIKKTLIWAAGNPKIKSIALDTINGYLAYKEYNERKKMTHDQWREVFLDMIELLTICNNTLRDDQIVYMMGHSAIQTQPNGEDKLVLSVIGKKMSKTQSESLMTVMLFMRVEWGDDGDNKHYFQTKGAKTTAKTPIGMFKDFEIPNSLKLVDNVIRKYYKLNQENNEQEQTAE